MNKHLKQFNKMFQVGSDNNQEDRVNKASTSSNVPPPPLYVLRKDHKPLTPGQEDKGPPGRFSHFLSDILANYADNVDDHYAL